MGNVLLQPGEGVWGAQSGSEKVSCLMKLFFLCSHISVDAMTEHLGFPFGLLAPLQVFFSLFVI